MTTCGRRQVRGGSGGQPSPSDKVFVSRCRFAPFTSTSLYAPFAGTNNVDVVTGDTTFAFADGTTCYNPQNETNIVINPTNARNLVTSANDYRYSGPAAYSGFDAGRTWTDVQMFGWTVDTGGRGLFKKIQNVSDPVLAFAPNGTVYMVQVVYTFRFRTSKSEPVNNATASGVAVASSADGGVSWTAPHMVYFADAINFFEDKPWMTVGPDGTLYVTWTRFNQGPHGTGCLSSNIEMAISHTGGKTWSSVEQVSDAAHPSDQGSFPLVAPNGTP
jgi:hypothetical protein